MFKMLIFENIYKCDKHENYSTVILKLYDSEQFQVSVVVKVLYRVCVEHTVAQLVEALRYKPEGCRFDS